MGRTGEAKPWWRSWKAWAGIGVALVAIGAVLPGGGDTDVLETDTTATTPAASASATVNDETAAALDEIAAYCAQPMQYANGAGFTDAPRDFRTTLAVQGEPEVMANMWAKRFADEVVNPDGGDEWRTSWLEARGLSGREAVVHAVAQGADGTMVDCYGFVGATRGDGSMVSWSLVREVE